jgi:MoaA/NifB/PqqE/SkfB family radical SAM enzyme
VRNLIFDKRPSIDGRKKEPGLICLQPFYFLEFTTTGDVYTCCPAWIKSPIGNIRKETIAEIWNSDKARRIRRKMFSGEWQDICNRVCPRISVYQHDRKLILYDYLSTDVFDFLTPGLIDEIRSGREYLESPPTVFNLSNSKVCNLSCIMCDRVFQDDNPLLREKTAEDILKYLPTAKKVILTGMGDPFARPDTRNLLINFRDENSSLKFDLITNALLLPKYWEQIKHQKFGTLLISVDAATKNTYDKIRIGGSWETLLQSLFLIGENRNRFSSVTINMTVMRCNYNEIRDFIDLAESYGFNASFQRIRGIFGDQNFFEGGDLSVLRELKAIIMTEQLRKRSINVFWGDLLEFGA